MRNDAKLLPQYWDCMMPDPEAVNGIVYHFNGIGSMRNEAWHQPASYHGLIITLFGFGFNHEANRE